MIDQEGSRQGETHFARREKERKREREKERKREGERVFTL